MMTRPGLLSGLFDGTARAVMIVSIIVLLVGCQRPATVRGTVREQAYRQLVAENVQVDINTPAWTDESRVIGVWKVKTEEQVRLAAAFAELRFLGTHSRSWSRPSGTPPLAHLPICTISDESALVLADLEGLEALFLETSAVTDAGAFELRRLPNLHYLGVGATQVTSAGASRLRESLDDCVVANLPKSSSYFLETGALEFRPKPEDLAEIQHLSYVRVMSQSWRGNASEGWDFGAGDADIKGLTKFTDLESVDLSGAENVTNEGLMEFLNLPHLRYLQFGRSRVTKEGVEAFRVIRPDVEIRYGPGIY